MAKLCYGASEEQPLSYPARSLTSCYSAGKYSPRQAIKRMHSTTRQPGWSFSFHAAAPGCRPFHMHKRSTLHGQRQPQADRRRNDLWRMIANKYSIGALARTAVRCSANHSLMPVIPAHSCGWRSLTHASRLGYVMDSPSDLEGRMRGSAPGLLRFLREAGLSTGAAQVQGR